MEPDTDTKKAILNRLLAEIENSRYANEVMGQTWQTIGNADMAKKCAEALAENIKTIAELTKKLEALPA